MDKKPYSSNDLLRVVRDAWITSIPESLNDNYASTLLETRLVLSTALKEIFGISDEEWMQGREAIVARLETEFKELERVELLRRPKKLRPPFNEEVVEALLDGDLDDAHWLLNHNPIFRFDALEADEYIQTIQEWLEPYYDDESEDFESMDYVNRLSIATFWRNCHDCQATGETIDNKPCPKCGGKAVIRQEILVPAEVEMLEQSNIEQYKEGRSEAEILGNQVQETEAILCCDMPGCEKHNGETVICAICGCCFDHCGCMAHLLYEVSDPLIWHYNNTILLHDLGDDGYCLTVIWNENGTLARDQYLAPEIDQLYKTLQDSRIYKEGFITEAMLEGYLDILISRHEQEQHEAMVRSVNDPQHSHIGSWDAPEHPVDCCCESCIAIEESLDAEYEDWLDSLNGDEDVKPSAQE